MCSSAANARFVYKLGHKVSVVIGCIMSPVSIVREIKRFPLQTFCPVSIALRASDVLRMSPLWTNRITRYECVKRICMAGECKRGSIGRFLYIICTRLCIRCDTSYSMALFGANVCTHDWNGKHAIESISLSTASIELQKWRPRRNRVCVRKL